MQDEQHLQPRGRNRHGKNLLRMNLLLSLPSAPAFMSGYSRLVGITT